MSIQPLSLCLVLAVVTALTGAAAGAERTEPSQYQQALTLYSAENNPAAFVKFIEVAEEQPTSTDGHRAIYMASLILEQKLKPNEFAALKEQLGEKHAYLSHYFTARDALVKGEQAAALRSFVDFIAMCPNDGWRVIGLRAMCAISWDYNAVKVAVPVLEKFFAEVQRLKFEGCQNLWPTLAQPLLNAYQTSKEYEKQVALLKFVYDWRNNTGILQQILGCYLLAGNAMEEGKFIEQAIATRIDDPYIYTSLASAYSNNRNLESAISLLERGFKVLGANQPDLKVSLAAIYEQQMNFPKVLEILQKGGPPYPSQISQKLEQIKERLPERYMPEWLSAVSNVVNVAVGMDDVVYALVRGSPWKIVALTKAGSSGEEIVIPAANSLQNGFHAFAVYPDGTFQVQNLHLDRKGDLIRALSFPNATFKLSVNSGAELFVVPYRGGLFRFDKDGAPVLQGVDKDNLEPNAMGAVADSEHILVANMIQLVIYDMAGKRLKTFGRLGKEPGEFRDIYDLKMDSQGLVYVADTNNGRIQIFDRALNYLTKIPGPWAKYIAVDSFGNVYTEYGNRIVKYAPLNGGARGMIASKLNGH